MSIIPVVEKLRQEEPENPHKQIYFTSHLTHLNFHGLGMKLSVEHLPGLQKSLGSPALHKINTSLIFILV
jgi:hypothetical protein